MQRQLLKRSQNRINKSEASFVSTESLELFWTIYNDDCSCSVVQMERWSVFLRIRDDPLHTAHNHSGFNKSKFYNGKYTHTISRGEKDGHKKKGRECVCVKNIENWATVARPLHIEWWKNVVVQIATMFCYGCFFSKGSPSACILVTKSKVKTHTQEARI